MQICPYCGKQNAAAEAYCYACGHVLPFALQELVSTTTRLEEVYDTLPPSRRWGTAFFDNRNRLRLTFRDSGEELTFHVPGEVVLGRAHDEVGVEQPDIDLGEYDGMAKGVSRRHLALIRQHDTIGVVDLGSANSTYLNGQRLIPGEMRILRDADELRLGRLVVRVTFI